MNKKTKREIQLEKELDTIIESYKDFVYIVSHDLNAPFRHIDGFSQRLKRRLLPNLDEDSVSDLKIIEDSVHTGQSLLAALLTYSRVHTREVKMIEFDMIDLIKSVVLNVKSQNKSIPIELALNGSMCAYGDLQLIEDLLFQLIKNAVIFHHPDRPLQLTISLDEFDKSCRLIIKDNGRGIPTNRQEKVFTMFTVAGDTPELSGVGMGLTIAKSIAQKHGGDLQLIHSDTYGSEFQCIIANKKHCLDSL